MSDKLNTLRALSHLTAAQRIVSATSVSTGRLYTVTELTAVDGDTVSCTIDLGFYIYRRDKLRLAYINTPERGEPGFQEAKTWLASALTTNKEFVMYSGGRDRYGRWIAVLWGDDRQHSLNQALLDLGLAVPYLE